MVKRSVVARLRDILNAMDEASDFLESAEFSWFQQHTMVQRAAERCIEIVSEASRHIPADMTMRYPDVPWAEIRAMGNLLRHDYQRIEDHVVWRTVTKSFAELRPVIVSMIAEAETE